MSMTDHTQTLSLNAFVQRFGDGLMHNLEEAHPPRFTQLSASRQAILDGLKRAPFNTQAQAIQAMCTLLLDEGAPAGIINGEMGTGKVRRIGA